MKYKCQKYLNEGVVDNGIERTLLLSADAVLLTLELSFKGSEKIFEYIKEKYKEHRNDIHGTAKITLQDAIRTIKSPGRNCSKIQDELDKLYCKQEQYKNILTALNGISTNACNTSHNPTKCKLKIRENSIEIHQKLINISNKIRDIYLEREQFKDNGRKDIGVEYKNEYRIEQ